MLSLFSEIINKNFILSEANTIRFILTIPLLLIGIRRFLKQIPLEDYNNNKKPLKSFIFDYFSKFFYVLYFILEGILYFSRIKSSTVGFYYYMNIANYFFLGLLVLILMVIEYHPWFITLRIIMFIFLQIAPNNYNVLLFNAVFILLCEIGLRQKPWIEKVSYSLFRYVSMLTFVLCFMKSKRFLFV